MLVASWSCSLSTVHATGANQSSKAQRLIFFVRYRPSLVLILVTRSCGMARSPRHQRRPSAPPTQQRVSAQEIQRLFNDNDYWGRQKRGEFTTTLAKDKHPAPTWLPFCTRNQIVVYWDLSGRKIAHVHQFLKPDGTLGASRKP